MELRTLVAVAVVATVTALSGCSSPSAANADNFAAAINAYNSKPENCAAIMFPSLGSIQLGGDGKFPAWAPTSANTPVLSEMVKEGLLQTRPAPSPTVIAKDKPGLEYSFTTEGKQSVHLLQNPFGMQNTVCVGHQVVKAVTNFTAPSSGMGQTVTEVQYTYTVEGVPAWARSQAVLSSSPKLQALLTAPHHDTADLVLTHNGWEVGNW